MNLLHSRPSIIINLDAVLNDTALRNGKLH